MYITILAVLFIAVIGIRWLALAWVQFVQAPVAAVVRARWKVGRESAIDAATLLAPIIAFAVLIVYSGIIADPHFAKISTLVASSLGTRHLQKAAGATATAPIGTGSSARDDKPTLRDDSAWAGREAQPEQGRAGGGVSGGTLPGPPWSPQTQKEPGRPAAAVTKCPSRAACTAESDALTAWELCAPLIEGLAPTHRWARAGADMHFDAFSTAAANEAVITYRGDGMLIRGNDGLWHRRAYSCDFDTAADRVLSARLLPETHRLGD
jgi:hypothetical protein